MNFQKPSCIVLLTMTLALGACNGAWRPASQAPRTYVAAHDTMEGECRTESAPVAYRQDGRWTVEDALPMKSRYVRCRNEMTTTPEEDGK